MEGKCIILCAPSGAGKTSITKYLLQQNLGLEFSISACTRAKRPNEADGVDYYFLTVEEFKNKIEAKAFIEWEEVYANNFYGTLKSEIERIWNSGKHVIFDVDVKGGLNLSKHFGKNALAIFIKPNSQREVVYKRRRHALHGERLKLDIANMMYDTCELITSTNKLANDYKNFEFEIIRSFGITSPISEPDFAKSSDMEITGKLYKATMQYYIEKTERSAREAFPIVPNIYENPNNQYERVIVPFSDGIKTLNVVTDLKKAYETQGAQLVADFEKNITLAIVDEAWKKRLRKMDELKQSGQLHRPLSLAGPLPG